MKKDNASVAIKYLFGKNNSVPLYAQQHNKPDPDGDKSWSMMRDMSRIWNMKDTVAYGYTEYNTLMIDDSPSKMREYPNNVLVIPEYTQELLISSDNVCTQLSHCIDDIIMKWCETNEEKDIREIMKTYST
eukprot:CAMPEP_0182432778 /NCGR_PEP_ID=MMETSP1167-20130531/58853_1 /TAXON_ID=2988 /ORGANISM="Mallomonas Sp, Strain CCMP3275" /LENGTH=130 /DNA_ID=CAMNT_0024620705 /DNA_START=216 /DNA_END=604 /DNA_ORIENTATION=+